MAARTILGEKGRSTGKVGHSGWSERDRIGFEQIAGATMGKIGNLAWWAFGGNDRLQSYRALYQFGAFRRWRQRGKACGDRGSELGHLRRLGIVFVMATGDRTAIIQPQITNNTPYG